MSCRHLTSGHWINFTPNKLFATYADLTPLLLNKFPLWGLNFVTQICDPLSPDLQEALQTDSKCSTLDLSALTCRSSQLATLCSLCFAAVCQFALIRAKEKLISETVLPKLNRQSLAGCHAVAAPPSITAPHPASSVPI
jgi:hypothetical protein